MKKFLSITVGGGKVAAALVTAVVILLTLRVTSTNPANYYGKMIRKIEFEGNRNTDMDDLLDAIEPMRAGVYFTRDLSNAALKNLYRLGYFNSIKMEAGAWDEKGIFVRFTLSELPKVDEVEFIGTDKVYDNDLKELIGLSEGDPVTPAALNAARDNIVRKYYDEGLFMAYVKVQERDFDEKENTVRVVFLIDEGEDIVVKKIDILGAEHLDPEDILDSLELKEDGFIDDGTFKESAFEKDKLTILNYYKENGYLDVELVNARWDVKWANPEEQDERIIHVTYHVKEGEVYYFNGYDFSHDPRFKSPRLKEGEESVYSVAEIEKFMEYTDGDVGTVFNNSRFNRDRSYVNFMYSQKGYIFTRVIPEKKIIELKKEELDKYTDPKEVKKYHIERLRDILEADPEKEGRKFVYHHFTIQEGDIAYIENIIIKGNKKTLDKVIRRQLLDQVSPGELFNSEAVRRSRERVYNLGFFKEVNLDMRPGSADGQMNLIISVEEQPTGTISLGGGFGTQTGFSIFTEVAENNLNGTGQRISGRVEFGPQRKSAQVSWTEPWIFDVPWSLTLSTFYVSQIRETFSIFQTTLNTDFEETTYDYNSFGFGVGIGHRFWVDWRHYHSYNPSFSVATNPTGLVPDSILREVNLGWQFKSKVINGISYDNRDNYFNTTEGLRSAFEVEVVGNVLGGDDHYNRYTPEAQYYFWLFDYTFFNLIRSNALRRWRTVIELRTSASFTHTTSPYYKEQRPDKNPYIESVDMLYLGGYESLRGWQIFDSFYPAVWQDGGMHRVLFGGEYRLPVEPNLLWFVFFFDSGALYENPGENNYTESLLGGDEQAVEASRYELNAKNLRLDRFRYSYGFGIRLQIPILPLRLYLAKRLEFVDGRFQHPEGEGGDSFQFVFGIGDTRY